jgi:hypothetical protein
MLLWPRRTDRGQAPDNRRGAPARRSRGDLVCRRGREGIKVVSREPAALSRVKRDLYRTQNCRICRYLWLRRRDVVGRDSGLICRDFSGRWATETLRGPGSEEHIYADPRPTLQLRAGVSAEPARHGLEFRGQAGSWPRVPVVVPLSVERVGVRNFRDCSRRACLARGGAALPGPPSLSGHLTRS